MIPCEYDQVLQLGNYKPCMIVGIVNWLYPEFVEMRLQSFHVHGISLYLSLSFGHHLNSMDINRMLSKKDFTNT